MRSSWMIRRSAAFVAIVTGLTGVALTTASHAAGFAAAISPSKFELAAAAGDVVRDTLTIINPTNETGEFNLRTSDWDLTESHGVEFFEDTLRDDSCRPWVRLERKTVSLRPGEQKRYRFEIHVPADAPAGLCRFAILIEPAEPAQARLGDGQISVPVVGRYAVITYVTIGDARPQIAYLGLGAQIVAEQALPTLTLRNTGSGYDRAFGQVMATDATDQRVPLVPSNLPVLPGRTEQIVLTPDTRSNAAAHDVRFTYPLILKGRIEIGGETLRIDTTFE
jgi:hypothetical protein